MTDTMTDTMTDSKRSFEEVEEDEASDFNCKKPRSDSKSTRPFQLYIASFGYLYLIRKILHRNGYGNYFPIENIFTPSKVQINEDHMGKDGEDDDDLDFKNKMLDSIRGKKPLNTVLLIDDSIDNIKAAQRAGYLTYFIDKKKSPNGISESDTEQILQLLGDNLSIDTIVFDADQTFFNIHVTFDFAYKYIEQQLRELQLREQQLREQQLREQQQATIITDAIAIELTDRIYQNNPGIQLISEGTIRLLDILGFPQIFPNL